METDTFSQEITTCADSREMPKALSFGIDELMNKTYLVIRFVTADGWRCEKRFYDVKKAKEVKKVKEIWERVKNMPRSVLVLPCEKA